MGIKGGIYIAAAICQYLLNNMEKYLHAVAIHLSISVTALLTGILVAVPLGVVCAKNAKVSGVIMNSFNFLRIVPSLAILVVVMPILGTGFAPALLALTILAVPPILINTCLGFRSIAGSVIESAEGMGMGRRRILFAVEFPLSLPLILTGIRTSAVEVIASATLAAYIGAGGLGDFIFTGLKLNDARILLVGGISVALLSILSELLLSSLQQAITKYQRD